MADDFPAAHSMDTTWFAVDAEGRVGCFDSGEAGAVPLRFLTAGHHQYGTYDFIAGLPVDARGVWHSPVRAAAVADGLSAALLRDDDESWRFWEHLLLLRDEAVIARLQPVETPIVRLAGEPVVVVTDTHLSVVRALLADGQVVAGRALTGPEETVAMMGVHVYEHDEACENWISGPYTRDLTPDAALTVDHLPPALARIVGAVRFGGLRFGETPTIQPVQHEACTSWQREWVDLDGARYPMPDDD